MKVFKKYLVLIILLLCVNLVSGIGLIGYDLLARIDYKPNLVYSQTYNIRTTSSHTQDYVLYVRGDLAEYVTLEPDHFKDIPSGSLPSFTATLRLPEGLDKEIKPGIHDIWIGVKETVSSSGGAGIGVLTASEARIKVRFLYPGKYIEAKLKAENVELNQPVNFEISLFNGGKEDLNSVEAKIDVYDFEDNKVATTYTEEISLKSNTRDKLHAQLDTKGLKSGEYQAVATVYYDNEQVQAEDSFKIGSLEVWVIDYTKEVPVGKISAFDIEIESRWNNKIEGVYASVTIGKQTFKTPTTEIEPWQTKTITGYFDATEVEIGEYNAEITLHYANKTTKEIGKVTVIEEGLAAAPVTSTTTIVLAMIIVLLVIADIIYLVYNKKRRV